MQRSRLLRPAFFVGLLIAVTLGGVIAAAAMNLVHPPALSVEVPAGRTGDEVSYVRIQIRETMGIFQPGVHLPADLAPDGRNWTLLGVDRVRVDGVEAAKDAQGLAEDALVVSVNRTQADINPDIVRQARDDGRPYPTVDVLTHPALLSHGGVSHQQAIDLETRRTFRSDDLPAGSGFPERTFQDAPASLPGLGRQGNRYAIGQVVPVEERWSDACLTPKDGTVHMGDQWYDTVPGLPGATTNSTVSAAGRIDGKAALGIETRTLWTGVPPGQLLPVSVDLDLLEWFQDGNPYPAVVQCVARLTGPVAINMGLGGLVAIQPMGAARGSLPTPTATTYATFNWTEVDASKCAPSTTSSGPGAHAVTYNCPTPTPYTTHSGTQRVAYGPPATVVARELELVRADERTGPGAPFPWGASHRASPPDPDPATATSSRSGPPEDGTPQLPLPLADAQAVADASPPDDLAAWRSAHPDRRLVEADYLDGPNSTSWRFVEVGPDGDGFATVVDHDRQGVLRARAEGHVWAVFAGAGDYPAAPRTLRAAVATWQRMSDTTATPTSLQWGHWQVSTGPYRVDPV